MKNSDGKVLTVRCPQCGQPAIFASTNPSRPFCSDRCRLIDLGQWADESYRVPAEKKTPRGLDDEEQNSDEE